MKRNWRTFLAIAAIALVSRAGAQFATNAGFDCYYRELGAKPVHLSRVERVLFTLILVTKDHFRPKQGQACKPAPAPFMTTRA